MHPLWVTPQLLPELDQELADARPEGSRGGNGSDEQGVRGVEVEAGLRAGRVSVRRRGEGACRGRVPSAMVQEGRVRHEEETMCMRGK
jgi:hypothetical protein